jgi:transposase-like protein
MEPKTISKYQTLVQNPELCAGIGALEFVCAGCGKEFRRPNSRTRRSLEVIHPNNPYCSLECYIASRDAKEVVCLQCGTIFKKKGNQIRKTKRNFCCHSCAATYNNLHKTHGTRRSKLEVWLEEQLRERYPDLEILFNAKETINAELDIHFPSLNLAFELNGIYHYEPIHGAKKLASIQTNDHRKFAACAEKNIALCIIDVSTMKNFKPAKGQRFLDIIVGIVDAKTTT